MRRAGTDVRNGSTHAVLATHVRRGDVKRLILVVAGLRRRP